MIRTDQHRMPGPTAVQGASQTAGRRVLHEPYDHIRRHIGKVDQMHDNRSELPRHCQQTSPQRMTHPIPPVRGLNNSDTRITGVAGAGNDLARSFRPTAKNDDDSLTTTLEQDTNRPHQPVRTVPITTQHLRTTRAPAPARGKQHSTHPTATLARFHAITADHGTQAFK